MDDKRDGKGEIECRCEEGKGLSLLQILKTALGDLIVWLRKMI